MNTSPFYIYLSNHRENVEFHPLVFNDFLEFFFWLKTSSIYMMLFCFLTARKRKILVAYDVL